MALNCMVVDDDKMSRLVIKKFIDSIIAPNKFKSLEVKDGIVIITGGSNQNKASLIGRNRRRFDDLEKIVYGMFEMGLKVI